jgi:hypothetical protein
MIQRVISRALPSLALFSLAACGGGGSSPAGPGTTPTTTLAPAPTPTPPVDPYACPLGKGTADTSCKKDTPTFLERVDAAIELLAQQRPEIFNLQDQKGTGGYFVKDVEAYYAGVAKNLQATGVCAGFDYEFLNVKDSNDFSDRYDILTSDSHARRGASIYQGSCYPANFPVDPKEVIAYVRVAFYGFKCSAGIKPPPNAEGKLPLGCEGYVTATPKDKDGKDVDYRIHGDQIIWKLEHGKGIVDTHHHEGQPFNWTLEPLQVGPFQWCATIQGIQGCLSGEVIP